jgi:hypothetical protein
MIMPPDHARTLLAPRRLNIREKRILAAVSALVAALVVAVVISFAGGGRSSSHGCVDVSLPYVTGGTEIYHCGAAARAMCKSVGAPNGFDGAAGRSVATQCRKAGLPVG